MKSVFSVISGLVFLAAAVVSGCAPADTFLRSDLPSDAIEIAATDTDTRAVTIEASASWMFGTTVTLADGEVEWLDVRYATDNPSILWVEALSRNESPVSRADTIVVVSGDGLSLTIPVRQLGMEISFGVTPSTIASFGARETATRTLTVDSPISWEHSILGASDWLSVTRAPGTGESGTLTVGVTPTRSLDPRRDTIVVRPVNEAFQAGHTVKIPILQAGIDLLAESEAMNPDTFEIELEADGGEVSLTVYARADWKISTDAPAERVSFDLTESVADIENGIPVVMTVAPNTSADEYTFTLTMESGGETYQYICRQRGDRSQSDQTEEKGT